MPIALDLRADLLTGTRKQDAGFRVEVDSRNEKMGKRIREAEIQKNPVMLIMGDKDIPYELLRKVMYTAARANFTDVSFAVNHKEV